MMNGNTIRFMEHVHGASPRYIDHHAQPFQIFSCFFFLCTTSEEITTLLLLELHNFFRQYESYLFAGQGFTTQQSTQRFCFY